MKNVVATAPDEGLVSADRHALLAAALPRQADPRAPKRPEGEAGANWVCCRSCGRSAPTMRLLRHAKGWGCAPVQEEP